MTTTVKITKTVEHLIMSAGRWSEESIREDVPRRVDTKDDDEHSTLLEGAVDKANERSRQQKV